MLAEGGEADGDDGAGGGEDHGEPAHGIEFEDACELEVGLVFRAVEEEGGDGEEGEAEDGRGAECHHEGSGFFAEPCGEHHPGSGDEEDAGHSDGAAGFGGGVRGFCFGSGKRDRGFWLQFELVHADRIPAIA